MAGSGRKEGWVFFGGVVLGWWGGGCEVLSEGQLIPVWSGEIEVEGGSLAERTFHCHCAVPRFDDSSGDPQSEACALSCGFSGKERVKDVFEIFGGDS